MFNCNKFRQTFGEWSFNKMKEHKCPISADEFVKAVDVNALLDDDETWADYMADNAYNVYYHSVFDEYNLYWIDTQADHEFIWLV